MHNVLATLHLLLIRNIILQIQDRISSCLIGCIGLSLIYRIHNIPLTDLKASNSHQLPWDSSFGPVKVGSEVGSHLLCGKAGVSNSMVGGGGEGWLLTPLAGDDIVVCTVVDVNGAPGHVGLAAPSPQEVVDTTTGQHNVTHNIWLKFNLGAKNAETAG